MTEELVIREDRGAVTHLTLNLPGKLNALSDGMIAALTGTFGDLMVSETQRVIVLKGAGKAFCAGHDLKEMQAKRDSNDRGAAALRDLFDRCARMMQMIPRLPQPVIAQTHGIATAAGCQLVASCDLAVAAEDCRFGVNGVNIGLFCSTPMVALSRNAPRKQVFEMLVTGEFISAARAREIGLINRIAAPEALDDETASLADHIAGKLGSAVRVGKRAFYDQIQLPLDKAYEMTGAVMVENMLDRDTAEGIAAFLDKRKPDWSQD
ncbi:enoyl-CoA hydratase [Roseicyclus marinus]|uniref:enoyl-CoA hydratase n=1 Tax=Roseicyclus marinus TaxID=2161673 RepID=UPI00240ED171|nr:enoyl-CoA hydratase [Roseicyclus marinus]MDG3040075.1 enoyl-CoA hydratase [Roseicyclus marinus]